MRGVPRRNTALLICAALSLTLLVAGCGTAEAPSVEPSTAAPLPTTGATPTAVRPSASAWASPPASPRADTSPTADRFSIAEAFGKEGWNSQIVDVAYWQGQFVALGTSHRIQSESREHELWLSTDGHTWMKQSMTLPDESARPGRLVPLGDGRLAILGTVLDMSQTPGSFVRRAWESRDLIQWLPTDLGIPYVPAVAHAVAYGPKGYVAAVGSTLWFAADGVNWQHADDRSATAVAAGGEGFVAVGSAGPGAARMDASGDGVAWYSGNTLPEPVAVSAVGLGQWVAVGGGESEFEVWRSEDGLIWTPSTTIRDLSGLSSGLGIDTEVTDVSLVTVGEELFMSLRWNHCCAQLWGGRGLWTSGDGIAWSSVALEGNDAVVQGGATDGETVVLGGLVARGAEGVLWVAAR